jgi:succinate dehydrogenase / fumarate reductase cytochrome b subunit
MSKAKRPLSPHLQVYDLPPTAKMSIIFRMMGVGLTGAFFFLACWLIAAGAGKEVFESYNAVYSSIFGQILMFLATAAFFYHACNGMRHLFWDMGRGVTNEGVDKTRPMVLGAAAALTVLTWIIALA